MRTPVFTLWAMFTPRPDYDSYLMSHNEGPENVVQGLPNWVYLGVYLSFLLLGVGIGYWIWG